jgi:hypothetical protein
MTWLYLLQFAFLFGLVSAVCWLAYLAVVNDRE